jgi:alkylation response protein AidB-like acyl-CoA dehydrogenase
MNFDFTPEQIQLRDAARKLATEKFKDKAAYWDDHCEFPEENKEILKSLGLSGPSASMKSMAGPDSAWSTPIWWSRRYPRSTC